MPPFFAGLYKVRRSVAAFAQLLSSWENSSLKSVSGVGPRVRGVTEGANELED